MNWLQNSRITIGLSTVTFLLFMERVFLDFRFVSLEMEAVDAIMPFTLPYMVAALFIFGGWIVALLFAVEGRRMAFGVLLGFNLLTIVFGLSTLLILCPTPCQTGFPIADTLDWSMLIVGIVAAVSSFVALRSSHLARTA